MRSRRKVKKETKKIIKALNQAPTTNEEKIDKFIKIFYTSKPTAANGMRAYLMYMV